MAVSSDIRISSCTAEPVMLNGWKHHLGFLVDQVTRWTRKPEQMFPLFVAKLKLLGESQFDIYNGTLQPRQIAAELTQTLKGFNACEKESYFRWIESSTQLYWQLTVSDNSEWTMRKGDDENYYIHIHPSRHSKFSQRLKANQLRTALATLIMANMKGEKPGLQLMNNVRRDYLGLSNLNKSLARETFTIMNNFAGIAGIPH